MAPEDEGDSTVGIPGGGDFGDGDAPVEVRSPGEITILFVDDERQLLSILASRLEEELSSLEVITASHGTEAVQRLDQLDVDCVVSDYKMPGMNGLELLKRIREEYPDVPFILFTSKGSEDIAEEAISADVTDYLQKNMGDEQLALLANRIENAVGEYRAKQLAQNTYQHVRRIHDRISDAYLGLDADWQITYVDEAGAELLKDSRRTLLGEEFWSVLPQAVGSPFETQFKYALESQDPVEFEAHYEPFESWFEVRAFPSEDGLSVYFRDVTDLKRRDDQLELQRERLESAAECVEDLRATIDDLEGDAADELDDVVAELEAAIVET